MFHLAVASLARGQGTLNVIPGMKAREIPAQTTGNANVEHWSLVRGKPTGGNPESSVCHELRPHRGSLNSPSLVTQLRVLPYLFGPWAPHPLTLHLITLALAFSSQRSISGYQT